MTQYVIILIAILIAELISAYFFMVMNKYKSNDMPYRSTLIHMIAAIIIYYPLIRHLDKFIQKATKNYVKHTQKITSNSNVGILIGFAIFFIFTWMALSKIWYNKNMIQDVKEWIEKKI